ncbi:putative intermembrane phospholipid transport system binding protein MlaD [Candidatus Kuenenia stuttgartiensis]|jgi:phospholipid/cholesterol/gamma-HCH transport system substrate-binding protein|nr:MULTISPECIES: outer membrane lipid asymmetry maintenance protein MlaD [Kuenenia]MBE7548768.1 outer membrane lipid asymmetry maintenance protein MlaD [Planctomycetia bacterium]MBZ0191257.1 outer membrane lipid asymmetry maintenance protein MlaD [Candidatus Kuenenia stuttgartiensis]MCF6150879.1 outer membrane lipid asymmetry maintenance protein MlaD [Candidatus Kuenenia stuttgartiensis]MCL4727718.1 outer membrane lipid asymmetry maintenance protein MlaD [Candidatus Kuenenia stuttgartiensis]MC
MKKFDVEIAVGIFIFCGILCMGYISVKLGKINFLSDNYYQVNAIFSTVKGLKKNTAVEIAGVEVGKVDNIVLENYEVVVSMKIRKDIKLQEDAIASIRTKGLLGEKYVEITPGGSDHIIEHGGTLIETEPPLDLEKLIGNFVFGKVGD